MTTGVSIVISTRNRCDDVVVALESCLAQDYPALEVLLYDDASTDGTADVVADRFPEVRLHASSDRVGYLVWRNRGFEEATGEIVISIDDDAYFTDPATVSMVVELFDQFPEAGALALPYLEPNREPDAPVMPDQPLGTRLRSYTGCAHALRRDVALQMGGYPEFLIHQGEERHLCLRMLEAGHETLFADTPPIVHLFSPKRETDRVNYYGYRNTLLFTGLLAPAAYVLPRVTIDSVQLLRHKFRWQTLGPRLRAVLAGWRAIWTYRHERSPVSRRAYLEYRGRPGHGPLSDTTRLRPLTRERSRCMN